jgi:alpha-glucosidase
MSRPSHLNFNLQALTCVFVATALGQTPNIPRLLMRSPNGSLEMDFTASAPPFPLRYLVTFHNNIVINTSSLGLNTQNQQPLGAKVNVTRTSGSSAHDSTYRRLSGKTSTIRDHYNAESFEFTEPGSNGRKLIIEARAYDDAIAFRYVVPEQANLKELRLVDERTEFALPRDPNMYALVLPNFTSQYESEFLRITASTIAKQGVGSNAQLVGLPLLMQIPGVAWVAITEADLHGSASMYLTNPSGAWGPQRLESRLAPHLDDPSIAVTSALPWHSAWRIIQVADDPAAWSSPTSSVISARRRESQIQAGSSRARLRGTGGAAAWDPTASPPSAPQP